MKQEKDAYKHVYGQIMLVALITVFMTGIFGAVSIKTASAEGGCMHLADMPLEVRGQEAPPLVNIVWDASGSMLWSIFTENDRYNGHAYVFPESFTDGWSTLSGDMRDHWQTQSSDYNFIYYSPNTIYEPWPNWTDPEDDHYHADIDTPQQHPTKSIYGDFNLNETFRIWNTVSSGGQSLEDLGIIIDNDEALIPDDAIVVDDTDAGYEETGDWSDSAASGHYGNRSRYTNDSDDYATWTPDLPEAGEYKVYIWYTYWSTRDENAKYTVGHDNGDTDFRINQQLNASQWVELGNFNFSAGTSGHIRVTRDGDSTGTSTSADAVMFVPTFTTPGPTTSFSSTGPWRGANNDQAYPEDASGDNYLYTDSGGTQFTATWTADNLDSSKTYDVYTRWVAVNNRSTEVDYIINHSDGSETVTVNQQINGGQWNRLASDLSFGSSGSVTLDHTPASSNSDRACADAVVFVESGLYSAGNIIFAHYFTQNEGGDLFLVDMDGKLTYFEVELGDDPETVDSISLMTEQEAVDAGIVHPDLTDIFDTEDPYIAARQNFANWYQFYRRRYLAGIAAGGHFINDWSDVFIRITSYPPSWGSHNNFFRGISPIDVTIEDLDGIEHHYDEKDEVLSEWYDMNLPKGNTPLRRGLYQAGQFFETGSSDDWSGDRWENLSDDNPFKEYSRSDYYPYFMPEFGGECQQAFAIVMTDGLWNDSLGYNVGNADNADTDFSGGVFGDNQSNTAADVAMHFYHRDLRENMNNLVPPGEYEATHQHMVTYAVSFGMPGDRFTAEERELYGEELRHGNEPEGWPGWGTISSGTNSTIDDLWHATVNARGEFYSANEPDELVEALSDIRTAIDARRGTASAVAASTVERRVGSLLYQGEYNPNRWSGDLFAREINVDTGEVIGTKWSASEELADKDADDRVILTFSGSEGIPFRYTSMDSTLQGLFNDDSDMVDYLRGNRSLEIQNGGSFRNRNSKLGDIVHSQPMYNDGVVYVGANDGMLHAFDAQTGEELFAYVPGIVHENLHKLTDPSYRYQYFVNGEPVVRSIWDDDTRKTILVGGLRQGGKGYYALDVTDAKSASETNATDFVKWEFTADDDNDLGYSFSRPHIMNTEAEGWVALFGNGYNSENENAVLFVVSLSDGSVVKKFDTGVGDCNGIVGGVSPVDTNSDGYGDIVYAGDLKGNLWKFDLNDEDSGNWEIAYNGEPLFTAQNTAGDIQPITSRPEVMRHCEYLGFLVIFGTGKHVNELDFGNTETQSIYGIWDWQEAWVYREDDEDAGDDKYFGTFTTGRALSELSGDLSDLTLLQQEVENTVTYEGHEYLFLSSNEMQWWDPAAENPSLEEEHVGWYLDLPEPGERVTINPVISGGRVYIAASIPTLSPCVSGGTATFYALDACTGGASSPSFFPEIGGEIPSARRFEIPIVGLTRRPGNVPLVTTIEGVDEVFEEEGRIRGIMYWHQWEN